MHDFILFQSHLVACLGLIWVKRCLLYYFLIERKRQLFHIATETMGNRYGRISTNIYEECRLRIVECTQFLGDLKVDSEDVERENMTELSELRASTDIVARRLALGVPFALTPITVAADVISPLL